MSESKKMKNNDTSSSSADNNKTSLLPQDMQAILQRGMTEGYEDGYLDLGYK